MTDLRTAAQQALEALEAIREADTAGATPKMVVEARKMYEPTITALSAALAQQAEPVACTWQQDGDSDSGVYGTSCGGYFNIEDGTPEDNRMAWCCYCGKKLAQELITENEDE